MEDSPRAKRTAIPATALPDELLQWDILLGLPAKDFLRCGAVCRSWRRLTTDPEFLLARHRRQPSLPLLFFNNRYASDAIPFHSTVDALDIRRTPAVRRPVLAFKEYSTGLAAGFTIHASCDGLLLLSLSNCVFYLCNPATRHWRELPELTGCSAAALYPHRPSGEHRVLFWKDTRRTRFNKDGVYHVLTVSTSKPRCIGLPLPSSLSMKSNRRWFNSWFIRACTHRPVLLHDCLHWHLGTSVVDGSRIFDGKVVVFDTVAESFRLMQNPMPHKSLVRLLEMDGTLGVSHVDYATAMAELWVLRDYKTEVWSLKHRIELPAAEIRGQFACGAPAGLIWEVVSGNGDMLVTRDPSLYPHLFHCDSNGKLLEKCLWQGVVPKVLGLCFRESLVRHKFFERKDGSAVRVPSFLQGL